MSRIKQFIGTTEWAEIPNRGFGNIMAVSCGGNEWGLPSDLSSQMVRDLIQQLSGKAGENAELHEKIDELTQRLDKHEEMLQEMFNPVNLPDYGTFEKWLASGEPVNPYRGKHIAFVVGKGVIASSGSLDELVETIEKRGKPDGLIFGFVPAPAALVSKC